MTDPQTSSADEFDPDGLYDIGSLFKFLDRLSVANQKQSWIFPTTRKVLDKTRIGFIFASDFGERASRRHQQFVYTSFYHNCFSEFEFDQLGVSLRSSCRRSS
jgi:hypothetical protein